MSAKNLEELNDKLESLEMLSRSILSEIKLIKEVLNIDDRSPDDENAMLENQRATFAGRRYNLSDLQESKMFNMKTVLKEHAKVTGAIKDLEVQIQELTGEVLDLKDAVEKLEKAAENKQYWTCNPKIPKLGS